MSQEGLKPIEIKEIFATLNDEQTEIFERTKRVKVIKKDGGLRPRVNQIVKLQVQGKNDIFLANVASVEDVSEGLELEFWRVVN